MGITDPCKLFSINSCIKQLVLGVIVLSSIIICINLFLHVAVNHFWMALLISSIFDRKQSIHSRTATKVSLKTVSFLNYEYKQWNKDAKDRWYAFPLKYWNLYAHFHIFFIHCNWPTFKFSFQIFMLTEWEMQKINHWVMVFCSSIATWLRYTFSTCTYYAPLFSGLQTVVSALCSSFAIIAALFRLKYDSAPDGRQWGRFLSPIRKLRAKCKADPKLSQFQISTNWHRRSANIVQLTHFESIPWHYLVSFLVGGLSCSTPTSVFCLLFRMLCQWAWPRPFLSFPRFKRWWDYKKKCGCIEAHTWDWNATIMAT